MQRTVLPKLGLATALLTIPLGAQQRALERVVQNAEAQGIRTCVAICDAQGKVLYRHRAAEAVAPASNMKLLTAMSVLGGLGAEFTFRTRFWLQKGTLVVEASGDPNWLRDSVHAPEIVFANVARELRSRHVDAVRNVELRIGTFTGPSRPATWPKDQLYTYYCAPTGPFVLQQGTFVMSLQRSGGANANVQLLAPPAGYAIRGAVREVSKRKGATYGAIDLGGAIKVRGKFYRKSPRVEIKTAVKEPRRWYRDTLIAQLRKGGVRVDPNATAGEDGLLCEHRSALKPAIARMLTDSSNFDAEQCLRVLGANTRNDGSLEGGLQAMREQTSKLLGRLPQNVVFADGSGLSKENRLTPGALVVALYRSTNGPNVDVLSDCMPVAGRSGTLTDRFRNSALVGRVRAKTGWIRGASSLSGWIEMPGGKRRCFSILMSYDRKKSGVNKVCKRLQEELVEAAAQLGPGR